MPTHESRRPLEELARLGAQILKNQVEPILGSEDNGKFVAIDVDTGDYEVDKNDFTAVSRLRARRPSASIWLGRVGQPSAYRMGWRGTFGSAPMP